MTLRIIAPHFVAGLDIVGGLVLAQRAAPILCYMANWNHGQVRAYCKAKGWQIEYLN